MPLASGRLGHQPQQMSELVASALVVEPQIVQVLDGLTAAMIGIMMPLVVADATRGTGRYNLAQGAAGLATGIGGSLSALVSGYVAQLFGYDTGFLGLAAIGLVGLLVSA